MNENKLQDHINLEVKETLKLHTESLKIANEEMGLIKETLGILSTDMGWLKRFFWLVAGSSIGSLLAAVFNLIFK